MFSIDDAIELIDLLSLNPESQMAKALHSLSQSEFDEMMNCYSPSHDALLHVDCNGFTVNHGNVGSKGIRYDFTR